MKYVVTITGKDGDILLTKSTIINGDDIVVLNDITQATILDVVRAFANVIADYVTEHQLNNVWSYDESPDGWQIPMIDYICSKTFSKINNQSDGTYIDKCTIADNVQSVLYDLIPSKYQVSISDVNSIDIAPIEAVEKLL